MFFNFCTFEERERSEKTWDPSLTSSDAASVSVKWQFVITAPQHSIAAPPYPAADLVKVDPATLRVTPLIANMSPPDASRVCEKASLPSKAHPSTLRRSVPTAQMAPPLWLATLEVKLDPETITSCSSESVKIWARAYVSYMRIRTANRDKKGKNKSAEEGNSKHVSL